MLGKTFRFIVVLILAAYIAIMGYGIMECIYMVTSLGGFRGL